jgi:DNA-directed RNA polymerase subunit H (RpoH/RPB5)
MEQFILSQIKELVSVRKGTLLYDLPIQIENTDTYKLEYTSLDDELILILFSNFIIGLKDIKNIQEIIQENHYQSILFIVEKITSFALKEIKQYEIFTIEEISINPLQYYLVPKHEIMTLEEEKTFFKQNKTYKKNLLPKIKSSDPVMKWLGGKKGNLIRITRKSPNTIESIYYRVVI